jgi:hypothetical protein
VAPPRLTPEPIHQLAGLAVEARREGLAFDEFWQRALYPCTKVVRARADDAPPGAVVFTSDGRQRKLSLDALEATRESWRRAYEGEPLAPGEAAVAVLMEALHAVDWSVSARSAVAA